MEFKKYQHLERFGKSAVDGIEDGECLIFYKIDGTNGSVWLGANGDVQAGSRNRVLGEGRDNQGFYKHITQMDNIKHYLEKHPNHRLYGEWLVPHSLKTYREDAWRQFYVFDVVVGAVDGGVGYIPYDIYQSMLREFNINYIPPLARIKNPSYDSLIKLLDKTNQFLIKDGCG